MIESGKRSRDLREARPLRLCPEPECSYEERAARIIFTRRKFLWSTRTVVETYPQWSAQRCPRHGIELVEKCNSCGAYLTSRDDTYCRSCGKQFWWTTETGAGDYAVRIWQSDEAKLEEIGRISVYGVRESITNVVADALISSDDAFGAMRSSSAGALKQAGGAEIESESIAGKHQLGDAWLTKAGKLDAKHLIHLAILDKDGKTTDDTLARALDACLHLADAAGLKSIVLPALGTGRSAFPIPQSAKIARRAITGYIGKAPEGSLAAVGFILLAPDQHSAFVEGYRAAMEAM